MGNAIIAFAKNADNLTALESAVASMTEKHVSLNVQPEHYDIVGECIHNVLFNDLNLNTRTKKRLKKRFGDQKRVQVDWNGASNEYKPFMNNDFELVTTGVWMNTR